MERSEAEFWSAVSDKYDSVVDLQLGKDLRRLILDRLSREADLGHTLEIGCGSGKFTRVLAERASNLVATDISEGMLEIARQRLSDQPNVSYGLEDCQKLSFENAVFDSAFLALVLQFVDADLALRELCRVLRPGGLLVIANLDIQALSIPKRVMLIARTIYYSKSKYGRGMPRVMPKRMLSATQLQAKLESNGFRVEGFEPIRDGSCGYNCPVAYFRAVKA